MALYVILRFPVGPNFQWEFPDKIQLYLFKPTPST